MYIDIHPPVAKHGLPENPAIYIVMMLRACHKNLMAGIHQGVHQSTSDLSPTVRPDFEGPTQPPKRWQGPIQVCFVVTCYANLYNTMVYDWTIQKLVLHVCV